MAGTIRANGIELYDEIHGDGPAVVLVAGRASDSQSRLPVIARAAERHTVIVYDNRGTGRTRLVDAEISIPLVTDDCATLIDSLGQARAHVIGHSIGGFIQAVTGFLSRS